MIVKDMRIIVKLVYCPKEFKQAYCLAFPITFKMLSELTLRPSSEIIKISIKLNHDCYSPIRRYKEIFTLIYI